jgi:hypothetical protein
VPAKPSVFAMELVAKEKQISEKRHFFYVLKKKLNPLNQNFPSVLGP